MNIRFLWDLLRGSSFRVERGTTDRLGEMPNVVEAHDKLLASQRNFYAAVAGVVMENEELRRRLHARENS